MNDWQASAAPVAAGAGVALLPLLVQPRHRPGLVLREPRARRPARYVFAALRAGSEGDPVLAAVPAELGRAGRAVSPGSPPS
ncbi:hypothetical protein [Streptomyces tateyamensis]|uniref:hypothetical protein n=1 Tax=Streptomyces tateyamensis TaxID=565073 RepID=UPI001C648365|nr:hypothetical protein [Streptomyces tateyamensis]